MKILLVGNLGYIGPVAATHLREVFPQAQIHGYDTGYFAGCLVDPRDFPETVIDRQYFGDVRGFNPEALAGADAVVQLAAISNDPMGKAYEAATEQVNHESAVSIARMARAAGVRNFVFASSCSVYGAGGDGAKTESAPLNPLTAYARSKINAEAGLRAIATPGFTVTCLRFATACGFSPRLRLDLVLNDFVAAALTAGRIEILSDGTPWRPLIHVRDMARAIEWAAGRKPSDGGDFLTVNAGSDEWNFQIADLARAVQAELGGVEISINRNAAPDKRSYRVDFGLFRRLAPAHSPRVRLPEAVRELAAGLRAAGFSDRNFRASRFIRLQVLADARAANRLDAELRWTGRS